MVQHPRINDYLVILVLAMLNRSGRSTRCDPDIPSRSIAQNYVAAFQSVKRPKRCSVGQFLDGIECKPCADGTFMTRKMAEENIHSHCLRCYEPGMYEITEEPCTMTRDAKIMCEDGYYRSDIPGKPCQSECRRCDVCGIGIYMFKNYEAQECRGHQNTICCQREDMIVVESDCKIVSTTPSTTSNTPTSTITTMSEYQSPPIEEIKVGASKSDGLILLHSRNFTLVIAACVFVLAKHVSIFSKLFKIS